jgi:hypothetical protein
MTPRFAFGGLVAMFIAAAVVTALGGGADSATPGMILGHCVVLQGEGWAPSSCREPGAVPADDSPNAPAEPAMEPGAGGCGSDIAAALKTIRTVESGGRYSIGPNGGGASGAYQFIKGTWDSEAKAAGRPDLTRIWPYQASPADQDLVARQYLSAALGSGGVETVGPFWYLGHVPRGGEWDTVPAPWAGNRITPRQYQRMWMAQYARAKGGCGSPS